MGKLLLIINYDDNIYWLVITIIVIIIKKMIFNSLLINIKWNVCQYLSMHFLISKVLIWVVVKFFKITSPKQAVCILFQALITLLEFISHKFVQNEGLNNLPAEKAAVFYNYVYTSDQNQSWKLLVIFYWSIYRPGVHFQVEFYLQI